MKKIIDGLRYDTEKAIELGTASHSHPGDFQHWEATLYKTPRSGKFFIAGGGGPMSRFSQSVGQNEWSGGEDLIPMSVDEAREWAERYLPAEVIEQHFDVEDA